MQIAPLSRRSLISGAVATSAVLAAPRLATAQDRRVIRFARKVAALILLLVIPLQGMAASSLMVAQCASAVTGAMHVPGGEEGALRDVGGDASDGLHGHAYCNQSFSGIPVTPAATAPADLPVFEPSVSSLASLFSPEQPQRPPFSTRV